MATIHTLASGSSGNALVFSHNGTHLLVDAGISCRRITAGLNQLGLSPTDLSGILITHTHSDHISGLKTLLKRCSAPVYASRETCSSLSYRLAGLEDRLYTVRPGIQFSVGNCSVTPFHTAHDTPGACGFRMEDAGILTDSGCVTAEAAELLSGVSLLVLEANHDVDRLRNGPYPIYLKRRIMSNLGHLSNEAAGAFAVTMAQAGTTQIVLVHLSQENNTPEDAYEAVHAYLQNAGLSTQLCVAPRNEVSPCYRALSEAVGCRK